MAKPKSGLGGRGLDSLLAGAVGDNSGDRLTTVPIHDIKPGRYQPRSQLDQAGLQELADSIKGSRRDSTGHRARTRSVAI